MRGQTIDREGEFTVNDFLMLGEHETPCQLISGQFVMSPSPAPQHQRILRRLFRSFDFVCGEDEIFLAPIDLFVDNFNVFQPDLVYIKKEKSEIVTERGIEGIPDLVVEILSPSTRLYDLTQKKAQYLTLGIGEYWVIDPENETLHIFTPGGDNRSYRSTDETVTIRSTVVLNLQLPLKALFNP